MTTNQDRKKPYIYVSFSKKDQHISRNIISSIKNSGFNTVYNDITAKGIEELEIIAELIYNCTTFLFLVSHNVNEEDDCYKEINYAIELKKDILVVYLEETHLSRGLHMQLSILQAIFYNRHPNHDSFMRQLKSSKMLSVCLNENAMSIDTCTISNNQNTLEFKYKRNYKGYTIVGYNGINEDVIIPDLYNNLPVTSIGQKAFSGCDYIYNIQIPDSIEIICDLAFENCDSLSKIEIPDSVISISSHAFEGCSSLDFNEYDNALYLGNKSNPYRILIKAKNNNISNCNIHPQTKMISQNAFYLCQSLTSISLPNTLELIMDSAFSFATNLRNITIPDSIKIIESGAFWKCASLNYNLYDNAYYLGTKNNPYYALIKSVNSNITECIIHPNTKVIIGEAFRSCKSLIKIKVPDSVTYIGSYAFCDCNMLSEISLSNSLSIINEAAFKNCTSLTNINIPESIIRIKPHAFDSCSSLQHINIPTSIIAIEDSVFMNCTALKTVYLHNYISWIGTDVFRKCSSLTKIDLPPKITSTGNLAFADCTSLTRIVIPDGVTLIDNGSFANCCNVTDIVIPKSVRKIGTFAIFDMPLLKNVYYMGNKDEWNNIEIEIPSNLFLEQVSIHYNYFEKNSS